MRDREQAPALLLGLRELRQATGVLDSFPQQLRVGLARAFDPLLKQLFQRRLHDCESTAPPLQRVRAQA
jgi:hypothetical protein